MSGVVFLTPGITGAGHAVRALAVGLALKRAGLTLNYHVVLGSPRFLSWFDRLGILATSLEPEEPAIVHGENRLSSKLHDLVSRLAPDLVLVDLYWFAAQGLLADWKVPAWLLCRQISEKFFTTLGEERGFPLEPEKWERIYSLEPFDLPPSLTKAQPLPPFVIRNPDEILSRTEARRLLGLKEDGQVCLIATNGKDGEFESLLKEYDYLKDQGWTIVTSTNMQGAGHFPVVDLFAAVDLLICGAGYNSFWEAIWFQKEAYFAAQKRLFENQARRLADAEGYEMKENGADVLARLIAGRLEVRT